MKRIITGLLLALLLAGQAQAITLNALTGDVDPTSRSDAYTTASVTITANRLALLCVEGQQGHTGTTNAPTIAGTLTATWQLVNSIPYESANAGTVFLFRTMVGSNQTGTVTITPGGGQTWVDAQWSLAEFSNVSTEGSNGAGAVVQSVTRKLASSGTSWTPSPALATYFHADNRPYVCSAARISPNDQNFVPSDGATEIHDLNSGLAPQMFTMWDASTADTTPTFTWTDSDPDVAGIAIEIKSSTAVTAMPFGILQRRRGM